jgi:hypothetical protein
MTNNGSPVTLDFYCAYNLRASSKFLSCVTQHRCTCHPKTAPTAFFIACIPLLQLRAFEARTQSCAGASCIALHCTVVEHRVVCSRSLLTPFARVASMVYRRRSFPLWCRSSIPHPAFLTPHSPHSPEQSELLLQRPAAEKS